jgi:hypothetical protein
VDGDLKTLLTQIRGELPGGRANARTVAALTHNPGCTRRRVIDAAGIRAPVLAKRAGYEPTSGQSPFAIASGTMFEWRLKQGKDYEPLLDVLRERFAFDIEKPRILDINVGAGVVGSEEWLKDRARRTDEALGAMARGDDDAPNLVDHPVLTFALAGVQMYLEPDALAFRIADKLEVVEIKSYAVIDGQADPSKVAATAGQSAVYVLALRAAMERLSLDPNLIAWSVILIAPRNFSRQPTAHRIPIRKKAAAISRVLRSVPNTMEVLERLPSEFTLGPNPNQPNCASRTTEAVKRLPAVYVPECLSSCDMAQFCRAESVALDDVGRIGRPARDALAGIDTLADVLRLARVGSEGSDERLSDVAQALQAAACALDRARTNAPANCGINEGSQRSGGTASPSRGAGTKPP